MKFGRVGWVAKGVVYALVGVLSLLVGANASGADGDGDAASGGQEASQIGAITRVAESTYGVVPALRGRRRARHLFALAAGERLAARRQRREGLVDARRLPRECRDVPAPRLVRSHAGSPTAGSSGESEDARIERFTRDLMNDDLGRAAVFAIGAVLLVLAAVFLWQAVSAQFESQLLPGSVGPASHQTLVLLGRIGWVGRSGMMALIGFFLVRAAVTFDASEAEGLDGSLRKAASSTIGLVLVVVVGAGLLVFGAFCILSAPKQRMVGADS